MAIPITDGQGQSSVATEQIGTIKYQQIKVVGGETGSTSVLGVNPDRSINVSVVGTVTVTGTLAVPAGSIATVVNPAGSVTAVSATFAAGSITTVVFPASSITAIRTNNSSVITVWQDSSILSVPVGSVITVWQTPSIVGTFAEDAGHTSGDKGLFVLGVRNDAVASFTSANLEYIPLGTDSAGRSVTKPFAPEESRIEGYNSVVSTSITTVIAAAGTGLRNYITDVQIANTGASTTLITFRSGGGTSVLGYTIAPTGGGSNISLQMPMRTLANETFDFQPTTASSVLFVTAKGFKAP